MKNKVLIYLSIIFLFGFSSCGNNKSKADSDKNSIEQSADKLQSDEIAVSKDCDEFIDQYEKWMNDYIKLIDKYMKNPTDAALLNEYMKLSQEGMTWINRWNSKLFYCSSQDKYQKRFDEITDKAEKKLKKLGIE